MANKEDNKIQAQEEVLPEVFIDDIIMSLKYYIDEHEAHIRVISQEVCAQCKDKPCLTLCPVGAYRMQDDGKIQIAHQSCIECGSCRVMCPFNNLIWKYPRGGYGVAYKFG